MIVVAIIGILAAIAIPQYQNYIAKSQVSRVMGEVSSLKTTIETCMLEGKGNETDCTLGWTSSNLIEGGSFGSFGEAKEPPATEDKKEIQEGLDITWPEATATKGSEANKVSIEATFGTSAATAIKGETLTWARDEDGAWSCSTTVEKKFAPAGCPVEGDTDTGKDPE